MNIVEAYIKFNNQLIILVSGLSVSRKTYISRLIADLFKIKYINLNNYYKDKSDITENYELPNNSKIVNYYTNNAIDWDKFNKDINKYKENGVIVSGLTFPTDNLKFKANYHVNLSQNKQDYIKKREEFITKHKDKYIEDYKLLTENLDKYIVNQLIYPYVLNSKKENNISDTYYISDMDFDTVYDKVFDSIINYIKKELKQ